jgi:glycosyltransferase involved in cell wall biosynthesis
MIRILQLRESQPDFETERGSQCLIQHLRDGFNLELRTIGPGGDWRDATSAVYALRRLRSWDIVHAWGLQALFIAITAGHGRIIFSPGYSIDRRKTGWLRAAMSYCSLDIVASTATQRRSLVSLGITLNQCHLIRPGVEFAKIRRRRDRELRRALGFADHDVVLLTPGETTSESDHCTALWTTAILHVLSEQYKLLLWGRGHDLSKVRAFYGSQNMPSMLGVAEERLLRRVEFEELLPAADIILITARGPISTLPVAICMAAGLPIISTVTYTMSEMLEDRHTALMTTKPSPQLLAQRLLELRDSRDLQWRISDMARTEAYEYFPLTQFLSRWRTVYQQVASGAKVALPDPLPGVGSRFHGRV